MTSWNGMQQVSLNSYWFFTLHRKASYAKYICHHNSSKGHKPPTSWKKDSWPKARDRFRGDPRSDSPCPEFPGRPPPPPPPTSPVLLVERFHLRHKVIALIGYKLTVREIARMMNGRIIVPKVSYQDRRRKNRHFSMVCMYKHLQHHNENINWKHFLRSSATTWTWVSGFNIIWTLIPAKCCHTRTNWFTVPGDAWGDDCWNLGPVAMPCLFHTPWAAWQFALTPPDKGKQEHPPRKCSALCARSWAGPLQYPKAVTSHWTNLLWKVGVGRRGHADLTTPWDLGKYGRKGSRMCSEATEWGEGGSGPGKAGGWVLGKKAALLEKSEDSC